MKEEFPIVSIVVITYNSAKFVLETLDSAKDQTYQNIELIISDDGSKDETISLCEKWLTENKERFVRTQLITVEKNTGIPANCNRGVKAARGEWIKLIAGDDILLKNCVEDNLVFAKQSHAYFIISDVLFFNDKGENLSKYGSPKLIKKFSNKKNTREKLKSYIRNSVFLNSPTYFYHTSVYNKNNGYDEEFKLLEDNPFIINSLINNIDIKYFNTKTVKYRINPKSVTGSGGTLIQNDIELFYTKYKKKILENGSFKDKFFNLIIYFSIWLKKNTNEKSFQYRIINKLISYLKLLN